MMMTLQVQDTLYPSNTYLFAILAWPESHHWTMSGHGSRRHGRRDDERAESGDPRHGHAHWSHPAPIVLSMKNRMDHFEVALQGDDHKTNLSPIMPSTSTPVIVMLSTITAKSRRKIATSRTLRNLPRKVLFFHNHSKNSAFNLSASHRPAALYRAS